MKSALIITHEKYEGSGLFGDLLSEKGFDQHIIYSPQEDIRNLDSFAFDLVLVMGGPMGVYESEKFPFLASEIRLLKKRIAVDRPTLGICLGSQLIAAALEAKVFKGDPGKEVGWNPLTNVAQNHPIRHFSPDKTSMFHWHGDTFDLPKGAELLASSNLYQNQAFQFGQNILAIQFHPEVTGDMALEWIEEMGEDIGESKIVQSLEQLKAQTEQNIKTMSKQTRLFFTEWLEEVGL